MRRRQILGLVVVSSLLFAPSVVSAQSQFTGQVRDESGAILPGVTVEAASPVLIEKAKTAVTDDQGRYTIVDLRPGIYKITFTLTGFSTILREGVELPSNFVATINADMKVGALEETITVTGQTPLVDVTQAARTAGGDARHARHAANHAPHLLGQQHASGNSLCDAGHRRLPADGTDEPARPWRQRRAGAGSHRRHEHQQPGVEHRLDVCQRFAGSGSVGHHGCAPGGSAGRRHAYEHDPQGRRQYVQRIGLPGRQRRQLAGE